MNSLTCTLAFKDNLKSDALDRTLRTLYFFVWIIFYGKLFTNIEVISQLFVELVCKLSSGNLKLGIALYFMP